MKKNTLATIAFVFLSLLAFAEPPNTSTKDHPMIAEHEHNECSGDHHQGDTLTCYVNFEGDPQIDGLYAELRLQGSVSPEQIGFVPTIQMRSFHKIRPGEYAVEGVVPNKCARGSYTLVYLNVAMSGTSKQYNYPNDFHLTATVQIENRDKVEFPTIERISSEPDKDKYAGARR